jgi:hypothetical protein
MEWTPIVDCAYDADITVGTLSSDTYPVTIQLKDFAGNNLKVPAGIMAYYADSATGLDPTDVTTDLAITSGGAGAVLIFLQYYLFLLVSEVDGTIAVDSEDSGTDDQYLVLVMPDGRLVVSGVLTY